MSKKRPEDASEVADYFEEIGADETPNFDIEENAQSFFDYYEAIGWKMGRNAIVDWKAAARCWVNRNAQYWKSMVMLKKMEAKK